MKRTLFNSIKALPYTLDEAVDRLGTLSAVLGIAVSAAAEGAQARVTLTHADAKDGSYEPVLDHRVFMDETGTDRDGDGHVAAAFTTVTVAEGDLVNIEIDLLGCKQFIKVSVAYTAEGADAEVTAAYVLTLGDFDTNPSV